MTKRQEGGENVKKKTAGALCLLAAAAVLMTACSKSREEETQKVFQIGFTTAAVENDPYYIFAKSFSDLVEEKSEGKMRIDVMGGGQLGQEGEMFTGMQIGTTDMAVMTNAYASGYVPASGLFDLPFIFKTVRQLPGFWTVK